MKPNMSLTYNNNLLSNTGTSNDSLEKIIDKCKNHPIINSINKHMINAELAFTFQPVTKNLINKLIKLLNDKKPVESTDLPTNLIKEFCDFCEFICKSINSCIAGRNFIA